ncbi:MAG: hypothetical protein HW405_378 [Candidatus Berkelbacteria bacterium]|nr:hypothetical protein [Candidatus Berkelbacteria bacterium]
MLDLSNTLKLFEITLWGTAILVLYVYVVYLFVQTPYPHQPPMERKIRSSDLPKAIGIYLIMAFMEEAIGRYLPLRLTALAFHNNLFLLVSVAMISSIIFGWLHSGIIHISFESVSLEPYGESPLWKYMIFHGVGGLILCGILLVAVFVAKISWTEAFWVTVFVHFFANIILFALGIFFRSQQNPA